MKLSFASDRVSLIRHIEKECLNIFKRFRFTLKPSLISKYVQWFKSGMSNLLIKWAALQTKYLTGPQNHHNILIQWKISLTAIRSVSSLKISLALQETKDCYSNQRRTHVLIKVWGPGGVSPSPPKEFLRFLIEKHSF